METIGFLIKKLSVFLTENENKRTKLNKNYSRFVGLIQRLHDHFKTNEFTWKSLKLFQPDYCKDKAQEGTKFALVLPQTIQQDLKFLITEIEEIKMMVGKLPNKEVELQVVDFIIASAQSVLNNSYCIDQKELLKKLQTVPELA